LNAYSDGRRHKKTNIERKMVVNKYLRETKGTTYNQKIRISYLKERYVKYKDMKRLVVYIYVGGLGMICSNR
jgi:hypothetical protein